MNNIQAEELIIGQGSFISPSASIRGLNGKAKKIVIGDNTYIGDNVQIIVDDFTIGDYCKVHHHSNFHGYKPLSIGHNAWIGQGTIIDSTHADIVGWAGGRSRSAPQLICLIIIEREEAAEKTEGAHTGEGAMQPCLSRLSMCRPSYDCHDDVRYPLERA